MNRLVIVFTTGFFLTGQSVHASEILLFGEPFNKITTCAWIGPGYFKLPGFDTCLKLGGRLRGDIKSSNLKAEKSAQLSDYQSYIESRLNFETKSQIGAFTISTFSGMEYQWEPEDRNAEIKAQRALIAFENEWGGVSVGIDDSLYTGFIGYSGLNLGGEHWSDTKPLQAALKIHLGNMVFGFGIEDIVYENIGSLKNSQPHVKTTDDYAFVSSFEYFSDFWDVKLSGIAFDVSKTEVHLIPEPDVFESKNVISDNDSNYNFAFNVNSEIRPNEYLSFTIGTQIGFGAIGFTGINLLNYQVKTPDNDDYYYKPISQHIIEDETGEIFNAFYNYGGAASFTLMGGFNLELIRDVFLTFDTTYQQFELDESVFDIIGSGYSAATSLIWTPTRELSVLFGAGLESFETSGTIFTGVSDFDISNTIENLQVGTRIEYVFDPAF